MRMVIGSFAGYLQAIPFPQKQYCRRRFLPNGKNSGIKKATRKRAAGRMNTSQKFNAGMLATASTWAFWLMWEMYLSVTARVEWPSCF